MREVIGELYDICARPSPFVVVRNRDNPPLEGEAVGLGIEVGLSSREKVVRVERHRGIVDDLVYGITQYTSLHQCLTHFIWIGPDPEVSPHLSAGCQ